MKPEIRMQVEQADWERLTERLLYHTKKKIQYYFGIVHDEIILSDGRSPEDIMNQAINDLLQGTRSWDPERVSLWVFLKRTVVGFLFKRTFII